MILLIDSKDPDPTAQIVQADLGLRCLYMPKDTFCMAWPILLAWDFRTNEWRANSQVNSIIIRKMLRGGFDLEMG